MDQLFYNAELITLKGGSLTDRQDDALAVRDGKILAVGPAAAIERKLASDCRRIDLEGRTVVPGFNDSHSHLIETGEHLGEPDLTGRSLPEVVEELNRYAESLPADEVLVCGGLENEVVPAASMETLDGLFPDRAVFLFHKSGHSAWFNRAAFERIGLSEVLGREGELYHVGADGSGRPSGHIADPYECPPVKRLLKRRQCEESHARAAIERSSNAYHAAGVTSVQDNTWYPEAYSILQHEVRGLSVTNWAYGLDPTSLPEMLRRRAEADPSDNFEIGPVKFFLDGAFGTHSAWLWEPYQNDGENCGTGLPSWEIIRRIERYVASRRQLAFHASGDRAITELCDALELLERRYPWVPDLRIRIEHAQLVREQDMPRIKRLGMVVSAQPEASGDFLNDLHLIGESRAMRAYPHRTLLLYGIPLAFGSDFPWEVGYRPIDGLRAVSLRPSPERIDTIDVLRAYTTGGAYLEFQEERKGTLEPGKDADLTVLSRNPLHFGPGMSQLDVHMTVARGQIVFAEKPVRISS